MVIQLQNRLNYFVEIHETSQNLLQNLPHTMDTIEEGGSIIEQGEKATHIFIIEKGWAIRYRTLDEGQRQIVNFMLPGDCFDVQSLTMAESDHYVSAATQVTIRKIPSRSFLECVSTNAQLATAFWWLTIQEESILREQIVRLGRRPAIERLAHLILELNRRQAIAENQSPDLVHFPIPQTILADALGLSTVHTSRSLSYLRKKELIETKPHGIRILNRAAMEKLADFNSAYLHMKKLQLAMDRL